MIARSSIRLKPIKKELPAFVGLAFEQLVQQWLATRPAVLPFRPEAIGSHWQRNVQVDAVAVSWQAKELLMGECKWGEGQVSRSTIRELLERKAPRITKNLGEDWTLHHAFFAREGFTDAAAAFAREHDVLLVDVSQIDADLHRAASL